MTDNRDEQVLEPERLREMIQHLRHIIVEAAGGDVSGVAQADIERTEQMLTRCPYKVADLPQALDDLMWLAERIGHYSQAVGFRNPEGPLFWTDRTYNAGSLTQEESGKIGVTPFFVGEGPRSLASFVGLVPELASAALDGELSKVRIEFSVGPMTRIIEYRPLETLPDTDAFTDQRTWAEIVEAGAVEKDGKPYLGHRAAAQFCRALSVVVQEGTPGESCNVQVFPENSKVWVVMRPFEPGDIHPGFAMGRLRDCPPVPYDTDLKYAISTTGEGERWEYNEEANLWQIRCNRWGLDTAAFLADLLKRAITRRRLDGAKAKSTAVG